MNNNMFSNQAADVVLQVIMLGGNTRYAIEYVTDALQEAYDLGVHASDPQVGANPGIITLPPASSPPPGDMTVDHEKALHDLETFVAKKKGKK